jgi:hypothetical protein
MAVGVLRLGVTLCTLVLSRDQMLLVPVLLTLPPPNTRLFHPTGEKSLLATRDAGMAEEVF